MTHNPYNHVGPHFDGRTYVAELDHTRLTTQLARVKDVLSDGKWYSLGQLSLLANGPEASIGARLRDLRKARFGGHTVDRKRSSRGYFLYRLEIQPQREMRV